MISYDKKEVRESLTIDNIFELLQEWGGDPEYSSFGIISGTICHNPAGEGSHKLYYYTNTDLFRCYTGCDSTFDIFELATKVMKIQRNLDWDLNEAVRYIAFKFGIITTADGESTNLKDIPDWQILNNYDRIEQIEIKNYSLQLKEYDPVILDRFNYNVKIEPWLNDNIGEEALAQARIGYYPGGDQITIPHYDKDGRFIGLRGRALCQEEAERFGKYRPLKINGIQYSHPLGMNLYNFNYSKDTISTFRKAIIFESEKSCLQYQTYFGLENDISVACCGSSLSAYQVELLLNNNVQEMIIAFDRQFQQVGDVEHRHLVTNLKKIHSKYKNYMTVSFIFDRRKITPYKASPTDQGRDIFLQLFKQRILLD